MHLSTGVRRSAASIGVVATLLTTSMTVVHAAAKPESGARQLTPPRCDGTTPADPTRDARVPAPFRNVDRQQSAGAVEVRMETRPSFLLLSPQPRAGDQFGSAILNTYVDGTANPVNGEVGIIGAPGLTVAGKANAGGIFVYRHTGPDICFVGRFTQNHPAIPGKAQAGARFGAALAGSGRDGDSTAPMTTFVGVPGQTVAGRANAGAVIQLELTWNADVPNVAGTVRTTAPVRKPRTGDRFGAVLLSTGATWYAGAPGATVYSQRKAGLVVAASVGAGPRTLWHQGDGSVGDQPDAGDAFGSSITVIDDKIWIGAPGEGVNGRANAGMVNGVHDGSVYHQDSADDGSGVPVADQAEAGDHFGQSLAVDRTGTRLMVGVPGEDLEGMRDAGLVSGLLGANPENGATTGGEIAADERLGTTMNYSARNDVFIYGLPGANQGSGSLAMRDENVWERWTMREPQTGEGFASSLGRNVVLY